MALIVDRLQWRTKSIRRRRLYDEPELARLVEFGRVSASLIHEMSTPLTAAALMLDQMDSKRRDHNITQARHNLRVLERYVVAARQQLKGETKPIGFSLTIAIHQVAMILSARAKAANVKLLINTIGSVRLYGDPVKFHQILTNLLNNAVEAYEQSTATRRIVSIKVERPSEGTVIITVSDSGVGISPKQLKRIFDPFYSTKLEEGRGLGLGLGITKTYIEQDFGGSIKAYSDPVSGTSFKLFIPLTKT